MLDFFGCAQIMLGVAEMNELGCAGSSSFSHRIAPFCTAWVTEGTLDANMRILLAVDGSKYSEAAVQAVIAQCVRRGTEILVLHVAEESSVLGYPLGVLAEQKKLGPVLVKRVAEHLRAAGFQVKTLVREGVPAEEIIDTAAERGADLIVLGSHGKGGLERFLMGSVSATVLGHAGCCVQVVRTASGRRGPKAGGQGELGARAKPRKRPVSQ